MTRLLIALAAVAVLVGAVLLVTSATGYVVYLVNLLLVTLVLSLGLHVVIGESGQFSLAHAAFYGIGIYATAIATNAGWPFAAALATGASPRRCAASSSGSWRCACATSISPSPPSPSARRCSGCS